MNWLEVKKRINIGEQRGRFIWRLFIKTEVTVKTVTMQISDSNNNSTKKVMVQLSRHNLLGKYFLHL